MLNRTRAQEFFSNTTIACILVTFGSAVGWLASGGLGPRIEELTLWIFGISLSVGLLTGYATYLLSSEDDEQLDLQFLTSDALSRNDEKRSLYEAHLTKAERQWFIYQGAALCTYVVRFALVAVGIALLLLNGSYPGIDGLGTAILLVGVGCYIVFGLFSFMEPYLTRPSHYQEEILRLEKSFRNSERRSGHSTTKSRYTTVPIGTLAAATVLSAAVCGSMFAVQFYPPVMPADRILALAIRDDIDLFALISHYELMGWGPPVFIVCLLMCLPCIRNNTYLFVFGPAYSMKAIRHQAERDNAQGGGSLSGRFLRSSWAVWLFVIPIILHQAAVVRLPVFMLIYVLSVVIMSVLTFFKYAEDKCISFAKTANAKKARSRIPEIGLNDLSFYGGWPGAILAQHLLRHKVAPNKADFRRVFGWYVAAHCMMATLYLVAITYFYTVFLRQV